MTPWPLGHRDEGRAPGSRLDPLMAKDGDMTQPQEGPIGPPFQRNLAVEVDIWTSQGASLLAQNVQMAAQISVLNGALREALTAQERLQEQVAQMLAATATPPPEGPPPGD